MLDGDGPGNITGASGVDIGNIVNHPYLENNPYRELANDDDDDNSDDNDGDDNIELVASPVSISETIIDVDEESTGVADKERTGVETPGNGEITGVPNIEDN